MTSRSPISTAPRVTQLAYCCDRMYRRWRFEGGSFPPGHTHCCGCELRLKWQDSPGTAAAAYLRYYYRRKERFGLAGLTTRGKPYRRHPPLAPEERPEHYRRQGLAKYHRRAARRLALELTTRGTPRKIGLRSPLETLYRDLRARMVIPEVGEPLAYWERNGGKAERHFETDP